MRHYEEKGIHIEYVEESYEDIMTESYIFNEKDIEYKLDSWKKGSNNILLITGLSGSGKSTRASQLSKEYNAINFELDLFEHNSILFSNNYNHDEANIIMKDIFKKMYGGKKNFDKYSDEDYRKEFVKFFKNLLSYCKSHRDQLFIIEGLQIFKHVAYYDINILENIPIIIIGTSLTSSLVRRYKRDHNTSDGSFKHPIQLMKKYIEWEKSLNNLRNSDYLKESVEENNDWSYIMETEESIEFFELEEFLEATGGNAILRDSIYPYIEKTFYSNPTNVRKFNSLVGSFIDRNIDKLTTSGPVYLIPFTDNDKKNYYDLFGIEETYIKKIMKEHTAKLNASKFKLLNQNPIFALFYFVIRYFTLHPDKKSLNSALTIYALSAYPSIFTKYFPNGVIEPVMQYTIDNLTDKFLIKKTGHILGLLVESIQHSYTFLKSSMKDAVDVEVIRFIQRIRNDHNSMFKKIMNIYMDNYKNNRGVVLTNTNYDDDTPIIDEVDNATTEVSNAINKVLLPIVQNGVDLVRAEASAKMAGISVSDCRMFLNNIINDKNTDLMQKFIESLLFLYIYEDHKTIRDVRSQYFLRWAASLFKKTNSKNKNINNINEVLNIWAENSGIYAKFHREASRINYKKAIFFYIVLSIQKYIG